MKQRLCLAKTLVHDPPVLVLDEPVQAVRRTAGELARTNEMNRRLANFCLDLVEEEAAVDSIVTQMRLVGGEGHGLFMVDRELKGRAFLDHTQEA